MDLIPSVDFFKNNNDDVKKFEKKFHKTTAWFLMILSPIVILFSFMIWESNQLFILIPIFLGILLGAIALIMRLDNK